MSWQTEVLPYRRNLKKLKSAKHSPPLRGRRQFSTGDELLMERILKLCIHVESDRAHEKFRIPKLVFPNSMHDRLNSIWKICALLSSYKMALVDRNAA